MSRLCFLVQHLASFFVWSFFGWPVTTFLLGALGSYSHVPIVHQMPTSNNNAPNRAGFHGWPAFGEHFLVDAFARR
jgi:hypothetical protein